MISCTFLQPGPTAVWDLEQWAREQRSLGAAPTHPCKHTSTHTAPTAYFPFLHFSSHFPPSPVSLSPPPSLFYYFSSQALCLWVLFNLFSSLPSLSPFLAPPDVHSPFCGASLHSPALCPPRRTCFYNMLTVPFLFT